MKTYQPTIIRRDFRTIPFQEIVLAYKDAADIAEATARQSIDYMRQQQVAKLEKLWSDSHEAPYEGNFSDEYSGSELTLAALRDLRQKAGNQAVADWIKSRNVDKMWTWMMPQLIAHVGTLTPVAPVAVEGQLSGLDYVKKYFFNGDKFMEGVYRFLMVDSRSKYLTTQYKGEAKSFCSLVPLIMYAHKLHNNIPYSAWNRDEIQYITNPALAAAMTCELPEDLTPQRILEIREQGLTFKSGANKDTTRDALSTYKLYAVQDTEIGYLPELAQTMLAQIWCAHPTNRTKYMVLDPKAWDSLPVPLIQTNIFKSEVLERSPSSTPNRQPQLCSSDLPWDI